MQTIGELVRKTPCIALDAVGTVLRPNPPAAQVYWECGRQHGCRLEQEVVRQRLRLAFDEQEAVDLSGDLRTSEDREVARWRSIVHAVFQEHPPETRERIFAELFEHYSHGAAWAVFEDAAKVIPALRAAGKQLILASNFDRRLRTVVGDLGLDQWFDHVVISSEVGWRKPARPFFAAIATAAERAPSEIIYVGDDMRNDYMGAAEAGMIAVHLDRRTHCRNASSARCIPSLDRLLL